MWNQEDAHAQAGDFELGRPALVCRWRLSNRDVPMVNRHLRALGARFVNGSPVSPQLVAWAKQHIEWTLSSGASRYPDGTLMIIVDERGQAAMTVGPYEPLETPTASVLAQRAARAGLEAESTGVAPETLWLVRDNELVWGIGADEAPSGTATLVCDLARTTGITVVRQTCLPRALLDGDAVYDEVFLVSDEHGIVPALDAGGPRSKRLAGGYAKLLDAANRR